MIQNDYLGAERTRQSEEFIPNDSFGMAQDLRRMHQRIARESVNHFYLPIGFANLLDSIVEFEDYCLNQPYEV